MLSAVQVRDLFTTPSLMWRSQHFMNVVPQKLVKTLRRMPVFPPVPQVEEDDDHQFCHTLFSFAPGLLIAAAAPAVVRSVDSAAAVAGGAEKEVCARTTSHCWRQLRFFAIRNLGCL